MRTTAATKRMPSGIQVCQRGKGSDPRPHDCQAWGSPNHCPDAFAEKTGARRLWWPVTLGARSPLPNVVRRVERSRQEACRPRVRKRRAQGAEPMSRRVRGLSLNVDRPSQDHTTTHERTCIARPRIMLGLSFWTLRAVKLPPRSPNLNAHAERFVRTIKESCLERLILFGEGSLRKAVHEFVEH